MRKLSCDECGKDIEKKDNRVTVVCTVSGTKKWTAEIRMQLRGDGGERGELCHECLLKLLAKV